MSSLSVEREPKICLFIPCFNVDHSIAKVLSELPEEALRRIQRVLIIDNGSEDQTVRDVKAWVEGRVKRGDPRFELYSNAENYSLGGSTILALDIAIRAGYDFLICMHGDGQACAEDLTRIVKETRFGIDFVLGSRLMRESGVADYSKARLWANRIFAKLQSKAVGRPLGDIGAFISFNLHSIAKQPYDLLPPDMGYQPLLVLTALRRDPQLSIREIPISWGKAVRSNVRVVRYSLIHLWRLWQIALGREPRSGKSLKNFQTRRVSPA